MCRRQPNPNDDLAELAVLSEVVKSFLMLEGVLNLARCVRSHLLSSCESAARERFGQADAAPCVGFFIAAD
jgi:hypothetical protein